MTDYLSCMKQNKMRPTNAANAIAAGLVRSGRARNRSERVGDMIRIERYAGGYYWLDLNGGELRQGTSLLDAEPLQPSFVAAMMKAGRAH